MLDYLTATSLTYLLVYIALFPTIHRFMGSDDYDRFKAKIITHLKRRLPEPEPAEDLPGALHIPGWDDELPLLEPIPQRWPATHLACGDDIVERVPAARRLCIHRVTDPVTVAHPTKGIDITWAVCRNCAKAIMSHAAPTVAPSDLPAERLDKAA